MFCRSIVVGAFIAFVSLSAGAWADTSSEPVTVVHAGNTTGHMYVPLDKGQLLRVERPFRRVSVGTREIADVMPMSNGTVYVLGKKVGSTNLMFRDASGAVVAVVDLVVTNIDISGLTSRLHALMPEENIEVSPLGEGIVISGPISSPDHLRQAVALAEQLVPGKVANLMTLGGTQQVLLEVKFAEVERTALKSISAAGNLNFLNGGDNIRSAWGPAINPTPGNVDPSTAFGAVAGIFTHGGWTIAQGFQALEKKGLVRTLAEPNLVAMSGDTASFLAGGEFPIPVAQGGANGGVSNVTVEFKNYGVGLSFTPTVVTRDLVNLVILSEVSSIDNSLAVRANGFDIPALKTRRAKTTVELRDGQSFAIAGLLQDDFTNGTQQLPFLGNLPVIGALFRSPSYQHNQTDLVVIITVHLVAPTLARNLATPLDSLVLPTQTEHFGLDGRVESDGAGSSTGNDIQKPKDNQGFVLP
jgi:pilus assembly protein CpaC